MKTNKRALLPILGVILVGSLTLEVAHSFWGNWGKKRDRWTERMEKETIQGEPKTVTNPPPPAPTQPSVGEGELNCKPGVVYIDRNIQTASGTRVALDVPELKHQATKDYSCTALTPSLLNDAGTSVNAGSIRVKCENGQTFIASATCSAPAPVVVSPPPSTLPPPTPPPSVLPNGCPVGYGVKACGSCCSDGTTGYSYRSRSASGKFDRCTTKSFNYRSCQNGQKLRTDSGICIASLPRSSC